ncbi:MAG: hypothetical protein KKD39_08095 [Candidatus Altiarchaeota archaeon]|nr:hypothetical protein [Candidatus Altiarchaeota archaeon]
MKTRVLGLDLGGLTIKGVVVDVLSDGSYKFVSEFSEFFYPHNLEAVLSQYSEDADAVGIASTAEYVYPDYPRLSDGIRFFSEKLSKIFNKDILWMNHSGCLTENKHVMQTPYDVASTNWVATSYLLGEKLNECILVDIGTSSADVIPIIGGYPAGDCKYDYQRLITGELFYTGGVFTQISAIVSWLNVDGVRTRVSSEYFCNSGDIHLMLGNIDDKTHSKYLRMFMGFSNPWDCYNRLAHMVCADDNILDRETMLDMASQIEKKQIEDVASCITKVYTRTEDMFSAHPPIVVAGSSSAFLCAPAARHAGFEKIIGFGSLFGGISHAAPALAVGVLSGREILNRV